MSFTVLEDSRKARHATVIASPDPQFRKRMLQHLAPHAGSVVEANGGAEALALVEEAISGTLLLDEFLPDLDAAELAATIRARHPQLDVRVINSRDDSAIVGQRFPPRPSDFCSLLQNSPELRVPRELRDPTEEVAPALSLPASEVEALPGMIGTSPSLQRLYRLARLVAPRRTTVLLTGETGTGKELVARALHSLSPRQQGRFVVINCAAVPEPLLEAELFGYNRGAFTGAIQSRAGRIQMAHGGTLLLDEVGDLPHSLQAKLLRFLQEGEIHRLGSTDPLHVDARIIAATNANLPRMIKEGRFRDDLYYRLAIFPLEIDPLRSRREDILALSRHFLSQFCQEAHTSAKGFSYAAERALQQYSWPGNVRELRQVIERAFILSEENRELKPEHFPWGSGPVLG